MDIDLLFGLLMLAAAFLPSILYVILGADNVIILLLLVLLSFSLPFIMEAIKIREYKIDCGKNYIREFGEK